MGYSPRIAVAAVVLAGILWADASTALCPHLEPGLERWSDPNTWSEGIPVANSSVLIEKSILLDVVTPRLREVNIVVGGRLVFSPDVALASLTAYHVLVKGRLDIGSEDCKFTGKAEILLTGKIDDVPDVADMGWKFIGVPQGGTLEIHGEERLSWTKLTKTLVKSNDPTRLNVIFDHTNDPNSFASGPDGIWAYAFDLDTGRVVSHGKGLNTDVQLGHFLAGVPDSAVVMMAVKGSLDLIGFRRDRVINMFETYVYGRITGHSKLRSVKKRQAWAAIVQRGNGSEAYNPRSATWQTISKRYGGLSFHVTSRISSHGPSNALPELEFRVLGLTLEPIDISVLDVLDDARTWREGDRLIIASTDYDWKQAELVTVVACPECKPTQVKVLGYINYTHWGEITQNVDMRAEVALLTRNIKLHGEMEPNCYKPQKCDKYPFDTFGGHIKVLKGFSNVHIEGAEIFDFGQQDFIGNYPVHFHLCEEVSNYANPPYVRSNSIHNTYARCVTVHATHGLTVQDNVAYDHLGHCYFLEDGGEKRTVFDGNLAIGTRKASLIPSDSGPASFWITNPLTVLRNNVAAGSEHSGIWYLFPEEPVVLSYGKGYMKSDEARHTKILEFTNNVAHSNLNMGLFFEGKLGRDHSVSSFNNGYDARKNPLDPQSEPDTIEFSRFTGYKNRMQNAWIRGNNVLLTNSSLSDSLKGVTFALGGTGVHTMKDSIIIGESDNIGDISRFLFSNGTVFEWPRSIPLPGSCCYQQPMVGFLFNEGPVYIKNVWFDNFQSNSLRPAAALGFLRPNRFFLSPVSSATGLTFGYSDPWNGNRVLDFLDVQNDGDRGNTFRDLDGSVTGYPGTTVVRPSPFLTTPRCVFRENWKLSICPHKYIKLRFLWHGDVPAYKTFLTRDDMPEYVEPNSGESHTSFLVTPERTYVVHFNGTIPNKFTIVGVGLEAGSPQRFGICLPRGGSFTLKSSVHGGKLVAAASLNDVDRDPNGEKYFWDSKEGILFVKMVNPYPRTEQTQHECPGPKRESNSCPIVEINVIGGNLNDGNCLSRAYPLYRTPALSSLGNLQNPDLTRTSPLTLGAGATRPFPSRSSKH